MVWSGDTKGPSESSANVAFPSLRDCHALFPALPRLANMRRTDICRDKHLGRSAGFIRGSMENEGKSPAKNRIETENEGQVKARKNEAVVGQDVYVVHRVGLGLRPAGPRSSQGTRAFPLGNSTIVSHSLGYVGKKKGNSFHGSLYCAQWASLSIIH